MRPSFAKDIAKMKKSRDKMVAGIEQMLESPDIDMGHLIKRKK